MALADINLSDFEFWLQPEDWRDGAFATLRNESPVHWSEGYQQVEGGFPVDGRGFWSLTRYDDVWHASRNPELFVSGQGTNIGDLPHRAAEFFGSMINMDAPRHTKLRAHRVKRASRPQHGRQVEDMVRVKAARDRRPAARAHPAGECDFVERHRGAAAARRSSAR